MLESLVATILNRILGSYVENFDPKQLNVGLLSGDVKLFNLQLKREALDKLHLPINVIDGHIGSLVLQIPYSNYKSKPVKILIEDVYMLAAPDLNSTPDDADSKRRALREKLDKLSIWEVAESAKYDESKQSKQPEAQQSTYIGNIVTQVIDNLQVTIKNIHVRYEDSESVEEHPFAMGITLGELSAISTNKNWEPAVITQNSSITHKLATLDSFAVYWDTDAKTIRDDDITKLELNERFKQKILDPTLSDQYLMCPVNGQGFLTFDKSPAQESTPKIHANLQFEEFALGLDRAQYTDMLTLGDQFQLYFRAREYRRFRPVKSPKEAPGEWFKYAAETVLKSVQDRRRKWTWEYLSERISDMKAYKNLYKKKYIETELKGADKTEFDALQDKYEYHDLVLFRSLAKRELRSESGRNKLVTESKRAVSTWSSWFWNSKDPKEEQPEVVPGEDEPLRITDKDRQELYEALELDDALNTDVSANQVVFQADVSLQSGSIRLRHDPHTSDGAVASVSFNGSKVKFVKRPDSFLFSLSLQSFDIADLTHDSHFPAVVKVHEKKNSSNDDSPFFWVMFEQHPMDKLADSNLFLKSKSVEILHNARFLEEVLLFFRPPLGRNETVDAIVNAATQTMEELREQTRLGLEYALEEHKTVNVKLDIEAPVIIIPLDPQLHDSPVTVIDAGYLSVTSDLVKREVLDEVKSKQATKYTDADWRRLESLMYDRFSVNFQDTQILIGSSLNETLALLGNTSSPLHILDKATLGFLLELSIVPQSASLPRVRLSIKLPELGMSLADVQYKQFLQTIENATPKLGDSSPVEEKAVPVLTPRKSISGELVLDQDDQPVKFKRVSGQRLFEVHLVVGKARLSLARDWSSIPIIDLILYETVFDFWLEEGRMGVNMVVSDLLIEDLFNKSGPEEVRKIAESEGLAAQASSGSSTAESFSTVDHKSGVKNLLTINYFREEQDGHLNQNVDISLAAVKLVLTPTTFLTVYDYALSTFTSPDSAPPTPEEQAAIAAADQGSIKVKVTLSSITALLNDENIIISRMELASAKIFVDLLGPTLKFQCVLGAVTVTDQINDGSDENSLVRQLVSIEGGGDLADFRYESYGPNTNELYNSLLYFRSGALKFSVVEEPLIRMAQFFARFAQMKMLYDQARMIAFDQAILIENPEKMRLDVVISSPIVVYPRVGASFNELLRANLGEIYVQNTFSTFNEASNSVMNHLKAGIRSIHLISDVVNGDTTSHMELVHDADFGIDMTFVTPFKNMSRPAVVAEAKFSPTKIRVTQYQFIFLMQLVNTLSAISGNLGGGLEDSEVGDLKKKLASQKHLDSKQTGSWSNLQTQAPIDLTGDYDKLDFSFLAPSFTLDLFDESKAYVSPDDLSKSALASFELNESLLKMKLDRRQFLAVDFTVKSFTAGDTRLSKVNKFPQLIPASAHEEHQLICRYTQGKDGPPTVNLSLDSPHIILALDFLFALQEFAMPGIQSGSEHERFIEHDEDEDEDEENSDSLTESSQVGGGSPSVASAGYLQDSLTTSKRAQPSLNLSVNVVDTYLIVLSDATNEDTEAIVFKVEHVIFQIGHAASLSVSNVGIFLTKMQSFEQSRVRLLDDFNITVSADDIDSSDEVKLMKIRSNVEDLIIRLSLREILLVIAIFEKASRLWSPPGLDEKKKDELIAPKSTSFLGDGHRPLVGALSSKAGQSRRRKIAPKSHGGRDVPRIRGESLQADFENMRLVLIEPTHQIPIADFRVKPFSLNAHNWSSNLRVDASTEIYSNIYNFSKSAWEPLLVKTEIGVNITRPIATNAPLIDIYTRNVADVVITPSSLQILEDIQTYFAQGRDHIEDVFSSERDDVGFPYRIHNETEFPLKVWSDSADVKGKNEETITIPSGEQVKWFSYDWRMIRENIRSNSQEVTLGVNFEGSQFDDLRGIPVNLVGENLYILGPKNGTKQYRIACETYVKDFIKHIVFRSTMVVYNHTEVDLQLRLVSLSGSDSQDNGSLRTVKPGESLSLPITAVDANIYVRPDPQLGYSWSTDPISWNTLRREEAALGCTGMDGTTFYVQAAATYVQDIPLKTHFPYMSITLSPPFEIINNLPYDFDYRLYSRDTKEDWTNSVSRGASSHIHVVNRNHLLLLSVQVKDHGFGRSEFAIISTKDNNFDREETLVMTNNEGQRLKLDIHYVEYPNKRGLAVVIMVPYVILNNTGQNAMVSTRINRATCHVTTLIDNEDETQMQSKPTLWSFDSPEANNKAMIRIDDSHWSAPISFTAVGQVNEVSVASRNRQSAYHLGFEITEGQGRYKFTRVVTITPRFMLNNSLDRPVRFREPGAVDTLGVLQPGEHRPVEYISNMSNREMCLSFVGENASWSSAFVMSNTGTTYVRLYEKGHPTTLVKIEVILKGATLFLHLLNAGRNWPYSIRNLTEIQFDFYQSNPFVDEDGIERNNFTPIKYHLPARSVMPYSWDFPAAELKEIILESGGKRRTIQLAEIGELPPAKYPTAHGRVSLVDLSVLADGSTQALVIAPYEPEESNYSVVDPPRNSSQSARTINADGDFFKQDEVDDSDTALNLKFSLKGIGISYINRRNQELCYATFRNLVLKYRVSDIYETISWQCQWIQVDNTLSADSDFPVIAYPTVLPKNGEEMRAHPTFSGSSTRVLDDTYGLTYIKHATLLLQEMTIEMDEDFLAALIETNRHPEDQVKMFHSTSSKLCDDSLVLPKPGPADSGQDIYFEVLHIQPTLLNLSFARTGALSDSAFFAELSGSSSYIVDALTMALGNINDAPVRLNSLLIENVRTAPENLSKSIQTHYSQELLFQVHKIVGSVDVIGSPIGLFNNISSGAMDLFYEPYYGYLLTDRPQDLGVGLAKGGASFVKKTVFGFSDSISKITGSLSKGVVSVTLDPAYQKKRRAARTRNHPRHALYGLSMGATSFAKSFASGVSGLALAPLEGAATEGAAGFFKGLGRGLVGLPTKTMVGVLDFTSNLTEGVRNTTTLFDANAISRVRLPRFIAMDGVIRPYNERDAVGQTILHSVEDNKFASDNYLAHTQVGEGKVVVVSYQHIILVNMDNMKCDWIVRYRELQSVIMEHSGLSLKLNDGVQGPFIPVPDQDSRRYIYNNIGTAVSYFNHLRNSLY